MNSIDPSQVHAARQALDRAIALHLYDPDVTYIDVGWRIKESEDRRIEKNLCVRVHRRYKPRGAAFEAFSAQFPGRVVSERQLGFPIDVVEGNYQLQRFWYPPIPPSLRGRVYDPLQGGISISNAWAYYAYGTLGGLVEDRSTGDKMILSNWHVLAGSAYAPVGLAIYQPGTGDGGTWRDTIGHLTRHAIDENIDAAVAKLATDRQTINEQLDIGRVTGVTSPVVDMQLIKSGRASEVTEGVVTSADIGGVSKIWYGGVYRQIRHVFHIAEISAGSEVSEKGDSGSWWLEKGTNKAVGLHFAGDQDPTREQGLAIAMPQVLDALNVNIVQ